MTVGTFKAGIAYDPDSGALVPNVTLGVYAEGDTNFVTPLTVTLASDGSTSVGVPTNQHGAYPVFRYTGSDAVWIKSGAFVTLIESSESIRDSATTSASAAAAAAGAAATSASAAASSAQAAVDAAVAPTDSAVDAGVDRAIADGRIIPGAGDWSQITGKPSTFAPTTGTTADTAFPGNGNMDGRYYTQSQIPAQVYANGSNLFAIDGYTSPRNHPRTGQPLTVADVVIWGCYASDPDPTNGLDHDYRADKPDPPAQPILTIPAAGTKYDPVSSLTTRNLVLPTIAGGETVYIAVSITGGTSKAVLTGAIGAKFVEIDSPTTTGIHGHLFAYENAIVGDSGGTVAVESKDSLDAPLALRVAAVAWVVGGDIPTSATVDGFSASVAASATSRATGTRTSGTNTCEFAVIWRTGNIGGNLVTLPDGTWTKVVEAADATTNGGGSAVMVAHKGLTTTPASTAQGGHTFSWATANGVAAETVAIKGV